MLILCNWDLAVSPPPPPTLWLRGGPALLLCRRWNTYFLWVISSIQFSASTMYMSLKYIWNKAISLKTDLFLINPSMRLKASYFRPKKKNSNFFFACHFLKEEKSAQVITLLEQKVTLWSHGKIIYLFSCGFCSCRICFCSCAICFDLVSRCLWWNFCVNGNAKAVAVVLR